MRYEVLFMFKDKAAEMTLGAKALRIDMETAFHILRQRDSVPKGMPWSDDFPEVVNHTSSLKARNHPDFEAAKHGDFDAAIRLVDALVSDEKMDDVVQRFPSARIAYIHCKEGLSTNMIPAAYAARHPAQAVGHDCSIAVLAGFAYLGAPRDGVPGLFCPFNLCNCLDLYYTSFLFRTANHHCCHLYCPCSLYATPPHRKCRS